MIFESVLKKLRQEVISTRKMVVVFKCPGSLFANTALLSRRAEAQANKSKNYINQEKKKKISEAHECITQSSAGLLVH